MELLKPFAVTGDREEFPVDTDPSGGLSVEKGYPLPYEQDPTEGGKFIERRTFNQMMYLVSKDTVDWKTQTYPSWNENIEYPKNATVRYTDGNVYVSKVDNNTSLPTDTDNWVNFEDFGSLNINNLPDKPTPDDTDNLALQETGGLLKKLSFANLKIWILSLFNPSLTANATLTGADNKIVMTGIVTSLGLEVGDVIQFTSVANANNQKMRTVESIINNNEIIVNYEHCGNRGNGSLKLSDETLTNATIKRVAKYYNAGLGLGQDWVSVISNRSLNLTYTNTINRSFEVFFASGSSGGGKPVLNSYTTSTNLPPTIPATAIIPRNSTYSWNGIAPQIWLENR